MKFKKKNTSIPGCFELIPQKIEDQRGKFVKTFHLNAFKEQGLNTTYAEVYYTESCKGVIRGLHFQLPPMDHTKLVYCVYGSVMDAVVDLRVGSPTFGKYEVFDLSAEKGNMIYVPTGLAHGFYVKSEKAILVYNVSSVYSPAHDAGIRWDSADIPWPVGNPILSDRDQHFPSFNDFKSPFTYKLTL